MTVLNALPFQYLLRGTSMQYVHGHDLAQAIEARDAELEDYLGRLTSRVDTLETQVAALAAQVTPTAWIPLPLAGTWANFGSGYAPGGYRKVGDRVYLRGPVTNPTAGTDNTNIVSPLPAGFQPIGGTVLFTVETASGSRRLDVATDGTFRNVLSPTGTKDFVSLSVISFSVAP